MGCGANECLAQRATATTCALGPTQDYTACLEFFRHECYQIGSVYMPTVATIMNRHDCYSRGFVLSQKLPNVGRHMVLAWGVCDGLWSERMPGSKGYGDYVCPRTDSRLYSMLGILSP